MIKIKKLGKKYGDNYVFKNFNYEFNKGIYLIKGASGKGKTTLLNIISGEDKKYRGAISVKEEILYFKDKGNLPSDLTVKEVYRIFELANKNKVINYFNVEYLKNKKIKKLSLGELQLVILNMVFSSSHKIILLDEPCSALSLSNLKITCDLLEKLAVNKLIIISSHNIVGLKKCKILDLDKNLKIKINAQVDDKRVLINKKFKIEYYLLYLKKTFVRKVVFLFSLIFTMYNFIYINNYRNDLIDNYLYQLDFNEGIIIENVNEIKKLDDSVFYEVIKKISKYILNYNANYYNSKLYDHDLNVNGLYIDNGFVLSSIAYIEENLDDNEIVLGFNYGDFCENNNLYNCDENYLKTLLINKKIDGFVYEIKNIFDDEKTVVLSNKRFSKLYEDNEYIEYYFDVKKDDLNKMFYLVNNDDFLMNFDYKKIGENEETLRYRVEMDSKSKFAHDISYSSYLICLESGYDCLDYLNHFKTLVSIDGFYDISNLDLEMVDELLGLDEIIISSKLSEKLDKKVGDIIHLYFNYNNKIIDVYLKISNVIENDKYLLYHNARWSYDFFKEKVSFSEEDLQIENLLVYESIMDGDKKSFNAYEEAIKGAKDLLVDMSNMILLINIGINAGSIIVLVLLEIFYNKFKKEYLNYLKILKIKKCFFL